ncbi:hypothetical protein CPC08DRAFT_616862, partial [Agrocybe pediades]
QVRDVLEYLDSKHLKVIDFLDGLSWGDTACTQDAKIRSERSILLHSDRLRTILNRWAVPPRTQGSRKARPQGASAVMRSFCLDYVQKETSRELE